MHGRVRRAGQPELVGVGQAVGDLADRGRQREHEQPAQAAPVRGLLLRGGAEHPHPDGGALVDQGREAAHLVPGAGLGEGPLDRAERPGLLAGHVEPGLGGGLGHRLGELRPQRRLEGVEVLALGDHGAVLARTRKVGRRWPGTFVQSQASRGTTTPVVPRRNRSSASSSDSSPGDTAARKSLGVVRGGHEVHPQLLGQRPDQRGDQLVAQARHLPGERGRLDLVQRRHRYVDRHPVARRTRLELVAQRQGEVALAPLVGVRLLGDRRGRLVDQHRGVEASAAPGPRGGPASTRCRSAPPTPRRRRRGRRRSRTACARRRGCRGGGPGARARPPRRAARGCGP